MTVQQAQQVKDILIQIRGSIPAPLVDVIYNDYKTYINSNYIKPCTCQPKYWNQMIVELKDKVESVLNQVTNEEKNYAGNSNGGNKERKKNKSGGA